MPAWYIFSSLGFYPVSPASKEYVIGSPIHEEASIKLDNGNTLNVTANNNPSANKDVKSISFNGETGVATIVWTFDVPVAGEYAVEIDYGASPECKGIPFDVLVDGEKRLSFKVEDTGAFDNYEKINIGNVTLAEGVQDVALDVLKNDVPARYIMQLKGVCLRQK